MRISSLKYFAAAFAVSLSSLSFSANAQAGLTSTSVAVGSTAQMPAPSSDLFVQLTQKIDSQSARVGDQVVARSKSAAILPDGTNLPKDTKLTGQITDIGAKSKEDNRAHVAFAFDHAVLSNGERVPIHAMLVALSAPAVLDSEDFTAPVATGGMLASTTNTLGSPKASVSAGNVTQVNQAPADNLPGVTFSSSVNSASTGSLDASGRNISLASGTQMGLSVSAGQR